MTAITCPTDGCTSHGVEFTAVEIPVPGPRSRMESPPTYCGACGALMAEEES